MLKIKIEIPEIRNILFFNWYSFKKRKKRMIPKRAFIEFDLSPVRKIQNKTSYI